MCIAVKCESGGETDREDSVAPGSSATSMAMLLGGTGNIEDMVLIRFCALDMRSNTAVGVWILNIERSSDLTKVVLFDELNDDAQ